MKKLFILMAFMGATVVLNAQFVNFDIGIWKGVFAAGDIDNDGDLDVIVSGNMQNYGDNVPGDEAGAILINDGAGHFTVQPGNRLITAGSGGNIHFGDIDGDGDLDVIFCGWGTTNTVKAGIALNDGSGNFTLAPTSAYPVSTAGTIASCGFADFDLDGRLDYYFFANGKGNCIIYFQQPNGSFTPNNRAIQTKQRYGEGAGVDDIDYNFIEPEVSIVDFDNDGWPDMWINAADNNSTNSGEQTPRFSYLFKNDGYGNMTQYAGAAVLYKKANGTSSWGDFNGDGLPDMLLNGDGNLNSGENNDNTWRVFENQNGYSIQSVFEQRIARQNGVGSGSVIVDWDNDGKLDFFSGGYNATASRQEIALYLGDAPAQFTFTRSLLSDSYFQGASEQGLLAADLNGDNKVDLLLSGYCGAPLNRRAAGYMPNTSATASVPPAAPTGLNMATEEYDDEIAYTFTWTAPAGEAGKNGTTYNFALKNLTTGKWHYNPMAVVGGEKNGWRTVGGRMGNVFYNKKFELYNLPAGNYEWTVQAINGAYFGGAFAETKTFTVDNPSSINSVGYAGLRAYGLSGRLKVESGAGEALSLKVFAVTGVMVVDTTVAGGDEISLPAGVYAVELAAAGNAPVRTKVLVK
jgi:hypothetical protein